MAKTEETGRREAAQQHSNIPMQAKDLPTDLLQRFINGSQFGQHRNNHRQEQSEETEEEIELSLGLSLNGRFGVDPTTAAKRLTRSSSIPDFINPFAMACDNNDTSFVVPMACGNLIRTCSMPTETEEDRKKRKELQTLRRMEAKRKRSEKQRSMKIARGGGRVSGEENSGEDEKREESANGVNQLGNCVPFGVQNWANGKGTGGIGLKGGAAVVEGGLASVSSAVAASQGSNGSSQGTGSSGISELESQPTQELYKGSEAISPSSVQSMFENEHKLPSNPEAATTEKSGKSIATRNESNKTPVAQKGVKQVVRNVLEDMPCVSTTGDGPNGKRIEGFLYRYRKGEEVRIVCVCHGSFLTPAEFVKHAGGGDVVNPLKHIVVNPYPLL